MFKTNIQNDSFKFLTPILLFLDHLRCCVIDKKCYHWFNILGEHSCYNKVVFTTILALVCIFIMRKTYTYMNSTFPFLILQHLTQL